MKQYLEFAGIAVVVLIVGLLVVKPSVVVNPVVDVVRETLGSASSPSVNGGCMDINGVAICAYTMAFSAASTTCSFAPQVASSTLINASARVTDPKGGTFAIEFGKGANAFSTTTTFGYVTGISVGTTLVASTTAKDNTFFSQGDRLNIKVGSTTFSGTGVCRAVFHQI